MPERYMLIFYIPFFFSFSLYFFSSSYSFSFLFSTLTLSPAPSFTFFSPKSSVGRMKLCPWFFGRRGCTVKGCSTALIIEAYYNATVNIMFKAHRVKARSLVGVGISAASLDFLHCNCKGRPVCDGASS